MPRVRVNPAQIVGTISYDHLPGNRQLDDGVGEREHTQNNGRAEVKVW